MPGFAELVPEPVADAILDGAAEEDPEPLEPAGWDSSSWSTSVRALRRRASQLGKAGSWAEAADVYEEACVLMLDEPDEPAVAEQLQACRLNGALCCIKAERWDDAPRRRPFA